MYIKRTFVLSLILLLIATIIPASIYAQSEDVSLIWRKDPIQNIISARDRMIEGVPQIYTAERLARRIRVDYPIFTPPERDVDIDPLQVNGNTPYEKIEGQVISVDPIAGTLIIEKGDGSSSIITAGRGAYILKDGREGSLGDIEKFDKVYARLSSELMWYIEAKSPQESPGKTSSILDRAIEEGLLTADQLTALALGDLEGAGDGLKRNVYNRLITEGVTPSEAEAIITQDWENLAEFSKTRLTSAISQEIGISKEMVTALMSQDWENARAYAQIEAANYLMSYLLKNSSL